MKLNPGMLIAWYIIKGNMQSDHTVKQRPNSAYHAPELLHVIRTDIDQTWTMGCFWCFYLDWDEHSVFIPDLDNNFSNLLSKQSKYDEGLVYGHAYT